MAEQGREGARPPGDQPPEPYHQSTHNGNGPPIPGFNPANLPPHLQEQLRRQMYAQQQMMLRQQQQQPPAPPGQLYGAGPRPYFGAQGGYAMQAVPPAARPMPPQPAMAAPNRLALLSQVRPYYEGMDEQAFMLSLSQFLGCVGIPLKSAPMINNRPVSMLTMFRVVTAFGGLQRVTESRRWPSVAVALGLPPSSLETLTAIHSLYVTLLVAYEQYMYHRIPADKIIWRPVVRAPVISEVPQPSAAAPVAAPPRAASTLSRSESQLSMNTSVGTQSPHPGPAKAAGAPLEAVGLAQWKSLRALGDPFAMLRRGKHSYQEICLCLESGAADLVHFGLNLLQAVALENSLPLPDARQFARLCQLLLAQCDAALAASGATCWALARRLAYRHHAAEPEDGRLRRTELVSNVLRSFWLHPEARGLFDGSAGLLVPALYRWAGSASAELRKNAHAMLAESTPAALLAGGPEAVAAHLQAAARDLAAVVPLALGSTGRLFLAWQLQPVETEQLKQCIIKMITSSTAFYKSVPPLAFVQVETAYRLAMQLGAAGDARERKRLVAPLHALFAAAVDLYEVLLQPMVKLCGLIHDLLHREDFKGSADYPKWFQKILHSASFGLPDNGYLEVLLHTLKAVAACLDDQQLAAVLAARPRTVPLLVRAAQGVRQVWLGDDAGPPIKFERLVQLNNPLGPRAARGSASKTLTAVQTDKSPLLWQACTATNSQPYQVFLVLVHLLDTLAGRLPDVVGPQLAPELDVLLGWVSGAGVASSLSREVLCSADLAERYVRLFDCALTAVQAAR